MSKLDACPVECVFLHVESTKYTCHHVDHPEYGDLMFSSRRCELVEECPIKEAWGLKNLNWEYVESGYNGAFNDFLKDKLKV